MESCRARVKRQKAVEEETAISTQGKTGAKSRKKSCATKRRKVVILKEMKLKRKSQQLS